MRFLVRMRGALTPPPRMDAPVTKIPLSKGLGQRVQSMRSVRSETDHPAPRVLRPMQRPMPVIAQAYGLDSSRKRPMLKTSPLPARAGPRHVSLQLSGVFNKSKPTGEDQIQPNSC